MIKLSTDDEGKRFESMDALLELMGNDYGPDTVPSVLGSERGRLIARITGCIDPYKERKVKENELAMSILPDMEKRLRETDDNEKLRMATKIACLGNVIDYDVPGNNADLEDALEFLDNPLYIDNTDEFNAMI